MAFSALPLTYGRPSRSGALVPVFLGLLVLCIYLLTATSDLNHNGDTDLRYQTTQALVDHGRAWIDRPMWTDQRVQVGRGGHRYAFYAPGQSLLMVPLYIAGKIVAQAVVLPDAKTTLYACRSIDLWLGALLAVVLFFTARRIGYSLRVSAALTLLLAFATSAWPDAQSALEQTQVDLFLLVAAVAVWCYAESDFQQPGWLWMASTAAGAGLITRYDFAIYLPILFAFPLAARWRRRARQGWLLDILIFAAGLAPWVSGILFWDWLRFGNPFDPGLAERTLWEPFLTGVAGLLVSPGKGLLWYMPVVLLVPFAVRRFAGRVPSFACLSLALVAVPIVFYANLLYWHGDPAWGPRYLYTAVPYLVLPLGELLTNWWRIRLSARIAVVGLILASILIQLSAVAVSQWRFWYRLQAMEQRTADPFKWGATNYHYYWAPRQSPILIQIDDVYQVARLQWGGARQYRLSVKPTPGATPSNPADAYPINDFSFWWANSWQPVMGARRRMLLAGVLAAVASLAAVALLWMLRRAPPAASRHYRMAGAMMSGMTKH